MPTRTFFIIVLFAVCVPLAMRGARHAFSQTLDEALASIRSEASARLAAKGVSGPFDELALVADKAAKRLFVRGRRARDDAFAPLLEYPVLAASGTAGPKLREGDRQVPEGVYRIAGLNPNSRFHLSLKVDYPNEFDRARADEEGRSEPGSDIFIHGGAKSVGCLALGDPAIEELFLLVADTGPENVVVLLCPSDPARPFVRSDAESLPAWIGEVDDRLDVALVRVGLR